MEKTNDKPSESSVYESGVSQTLFLTINRPSQHITDAEKARREELRIEKRERMMKANFLPLLYAPKYCMKRRVAFIDYKDGKPIRVSYKETPCNSWRCPICAPRKARHVALLIRDVAILNNLRYFLTLTLDPAKIPTQYKYDTHKYITKIFNKFATYLKRSKLTYFHQGQKREYTVVLNHAEKKLKYIWVVEYQENGNAHLHILFNRYLPIDQVRKIWEQVGGGAQMYIEKVRSLIGASVYVSKYITKGLTQKIKDDTYFHPRRGLYPFKYFQKRYSISQSCERPPKRDVRPFSKETGKALKRKLREANLTKVYNRLHDIFYSEEVIDL